ncbi:MAG: hypothetical protein QOE47_1204, partial [Pyrinomonadaceae bacterium]|nr:hypothetical protein [Pyrinomonadaceae bacterium]
ARVVFANDDGDDAESLTATRTTEATAEQARESEARV